MGYVVDDPVALVTLDRPETLNALTLEMVSALRELVDTAVADARVVGIVVTGAGRGFSKRGLVSEQATSWILPRLVGAGAALDLLWSSRRIDAEEAYRIGMVRQVVEPSDLLAAARRYVEDLAENVSPASLADTKRPVCRHLGVGYEDALREVDEVQCAALDRIVGADRARDLSFLPRKVEAPEALQLGLVARVFEPDDFRDETEAILATLLRKSPTALRGLKAHYVAAERMGLGEFVDFEAERHLTIAVSADTAEAFRAFVEKREPRLS
jgi:2-(1,2-epoxy-1,2-dihydrophenyl)acetyl-CoA isomerase